MQQRPSVSEVARKYVRKGWSVVPIPSRKKAPVCEAWQDSRITKSETQEYFPEGSNIEILLGKPSENLIDTDLDCEVAVRLAPEPAR